MKENPNEQDGALNIELTEELAEGVYANLALISHSNAEFVVDFIRVMPNVPKAKVKSRIILTPQHAKRLLQALADNLRKYEEQFGKIKDQEFSGAMPIHFGGPPGQA